MARPRRVDMGLVAQAQALALEAKTVDDLRCAQAVLLPGLLDATLEETAAMLGVGRATVARYQSRLRERVKQPSLTLPQWGGRRRAAMTMEEERRFLEPWAKLSADGGMLVVSPLRAALAQELGHPVAASVVYRLLARHGWRKVAPDTRHPKSDATAQQEWKKTPPRVGSLARTRRRSRPQSAADVPRRGTFRPHGAHPPLLGARAAAAHSVQWLRT